MYATANDALLSASVNVILRDKTSQFGQSEMHLMAKPNRRLSDFYLMVFMNI